MSWKDNKILNGNNRKMDLHKYQTIITSICRIKNCKPPNNFYQEKINYNQW
jgi:hypothetical protein